LPGQAVNAGAFFAEITGAMLPARGESIRNPLVPVVAGSGDAGQPLPLGGR